MGGWSIFSAIWRKIYGKKPVRILILGLDAAGKTTMLYRLKLGEVVTTIPTIGFNVESVEHNKVNITMWDVGGRDKVRPLFRHYYPNTDALIFVVDSADQERLRDIKDELHVVLQEDEFKFRDEDVPVLVVANKQDLAGALSVMSVAEKLELNKIRQPWYIVPAVATEGKGLYDGLDWLCNYLGKKYAKKDVTNYVSSSVKDVQKSMTNTKPAENFWKALSKSWCTISNWWGKNEQPEDKADNSNSEQPVVSG